MSLFIVGLLFLLPSETDSDICQVQEVASATSEK
jgi:hypothetical protein